MSGEARIYRGRVVHKRLRPKVHALEYRVFSMLLDIDLIDDVARRCRLFSRNAFNLFSFNDRDYGPGDGTPVATHARAAFQTAGLPVEGRILMLTYPRMFGFVFNPLTVYFAHDAQGRLASLLYEVSNTFGERMSYAVPAGPAHDGVHAHGCGKSLYVSPFTEQSGRYTFRVTPPGEQVVVAVLLRDADGALLKTHFSGRAEPLTDAALARIAVAFPLMTLKVILAIHWEALKLWVKGVPLTARRPSPSFSVRGPAAVTASPPAPAVNQD